MAFNNQKGLKTMTNALAMSPLELKSGFPNTNFCLKESGFLK